MTNIENFNFKGAYDEIGIYAVHTDNEYELCYLDSRYDESGNGYGNVFTYSQIVYTEENGREVNLIAYETNVKDLSEIYNFHESIKNNRFKEVRDFKYDTVKRMILNSEIAQLKHEREKRKLKNK